MDREEFENLSESTKADYIHSSFSPVMKAVLLLEVLECIETDVEKKKEYTEGIKRIKATDPYLWMETAPELKE